MRTGIALGASAGALWGLMFLAPRWLPDFTPLEIAGGRFLIYGMISVLCLLPALSRIASGFAPGDLQRLVVLALTGNVVFYALLAAAIQHVGIAPASLIVGLVPLTVTLLSRGEQDAPSLRRLALPLMLVIAGLLSIHLDAFGALGESRRDTLIGLACASAALLSWSGFAVLNARHLKARPHLDSRRWSLLIGVASGVVAGTAWLAWWLWQPDAASHSPERWLTFWTVSLVIGLLGSVVANALWNAASRRLPLSLTGQVFVFEPLFALLYGFLYMARSPRPLESLAIGLLLGGVLWSIRLHRPETAR